MSGGGRDTSDSSGLDRKKSAIPPIMRGDDFDKYQVVNQDGIGIIRIRVDEKTVGSDVGKQFSIDSTDIVWGIGIFAVISVVFFIVYIIQRCQSKRARTQARKRETRKAMTDTITALSLVSPLTNHPTAKTSDATPPDDKVTPPNAPPRRPPRMNRASRDSDATIIAITVEDFDAGEVNVLQPGSEDQEYQRSSSMSSIDEPIIRNEQRWSSVDSIDEFDNYPVTQYRRSSCSSSSSVALSLVLDERTWQPVIKERRDSAELDEKNIATFLRQSRGFAMQL